MNIYHDYKNVTDIDTNEEAINNSIRNILITRIGSVPGKPEFGSRLAELVFELMDGLPKELVYRYILEALLKWEPRIDIINIETKAIPEYNKIITTIAYQYKLLGKFVDGKANIVLKD